MDAAPNNDAGLVKVKKTLVLNSKAIEYGEAMAISDHRGCLSNQISWLLIEEWNRRSGKPSEVAA